MDYKSRVYTDRPAYADFDSAAKFTAIQRGSEEAESGGNR